MCNSLKFSYVHSLLTCKVTSPSKDGRDV
uniref:Uncharacterized protein n=1 Tax=Anguilla anguilla TaxID=7936 RepID=A0A0E9RYP1_ANGAN